MREGRQMESWGEGGSSNETHRTHTHTSHANARRGVRAIGQTYSAYNFHIKLQAKSDGDFFSFISTGLSKCESCNLFIPQQAFGERGNAVCVCGFVFVHRRGRTLSLPHSQRSAQRLNNSNNNTEPCTTIHSYIFICHHLSGSAG